MTPWGLAFPGEANPEGEKFFEFTDAWSSTETLTDLIFISEILIAFNTCGFNVEECKYFYERKTIAT